MKRMTCVFVGLPAEDLPYACDIKNKRFRTVQDTLIAEIGCLYGKGCKVFVADITPGLGLVWAELVLDFKRKCKDESIKLICLLSDEEEVNSWHEVWRERYFDILAESAKSVLICQQKNEHSQEISYFCFEDS